MKGKHHFYDNYLIAYFDINLCPGYVVAALNKELYDY